MGCGVRLVRDLSSGRCSSPGSYGCAPKLGSRLFYVRNGCAGTFFCAGMPAREVIEPDRTRSCGSGTPGIEHECDCRWSLPLVVPLHPPRWPAPCLALPFPAPLRHPALLPKVRVRLQSLPVNCPSSGARALLLGPKPPPFRTGLQLACRPRQLRAPVRASVRSARNGRVGGRGEAPFHRDPAHSERARREEAARTGAHLPRAGG